MLRPCRKDQMIDKDTFDTLLKKHARVDSFSMDDQIFGGGINISSIRFTELIMDLEEECDLEIDIDDLDASIKTVGQLYERLSTY